MKGCNIKWLDRKALLRGELVAMAREETNRCDEQVDQGAGLRLAAAMYEMWEVLGGAMTRRSFV